jgi:PAS domain S-box-containing protein
MHREGQSKMNSGVRGYAFALAAVVVIAAVRFALIPLLGNRFGFDLFLIGIFVCGRYFGVGSSLIALAGGAVLVTAFQFVSSHGPARDPFFSIGLAAYIVFGAIVVALCRAELAAREALEREIAERKWAEDVVRASESHLRAILDNTTAVIFVKDLAGCYTLVNRRWEDLFHIERHEIVGKTAYRPFPREVADKLLEHDRTVIEDEKAIEVEETVPQDDGLHTYITVKFPIRDASGVVTAVGGISTDITDRKKATEALEAEQELLRHTIEVQDQLRQLITYEIHDGLVQYATGALMELEGLRNRLDDEGLADKLDKVIVVLQKTVAEGRRIINGIRPPVLDDLGIVAAVEQLILDEASPHVQVEFVRDSHLPRLAPGIEEALYHITQEALTNVRRHSQSTQARIEIGLRGDRLHLEVRDWGIGFQPVHSAKGIHGLRGMTHRARIAGGRCRIESAPGQGTQVVVDVPYLGRN